MATESTLPRTRGMQLCAALNPAQPTGHEIFTACYAAHYRYVFRLCRRYFRRREDAEDAAAEVFLKLYRVLNQRDETVPFRPWLSQVAGHHCIDKLRRRKYETSSL